MLIDSERVGGEMGKRGMVREENDEQQGEQQYQQQDTSKTITPPYSTTVTSSLVRTTLLRLARLPPLSKPSPSRKLLLLLRVTKISLLSTRGGAGSSGLRRGFEQHFEDVSPAAAVAEEELDSESSPFFPSPFPDNTPFLPLASTSPETLFRERSRSPPPRPRAPTPPLRTRNPHRGSPYPCYPYIDSLPRSRNTSGRFWPTLILVD
ncbi:hypothetical protein BCR35DRAFT_92969 [Leucosporidium creatinivorum]|uniref:Uncharacterized protein n=1 Tax=Leucosporidium creatinivorum TaxID=106004 RepID=A0A1Y2FAB1_9BASI|nr:hypothetical protein BCR35DRAFT_92969 [Leucosporidium creatinivorum]